MYFLTSTLKICFLALCYLFENAVEVVSDQQVVEKIFEIILKRSPKSPSLIMLDVDVPLPVVKHMNMPRVQTSISDKLYRSRVNFEDEVSSQGTGGSSHGTGGSGHGRGANVDEREGHDENWVIDDGSKFRGQSLKMEK